MHLCAGPDGRHAMMLRFVVAEVIGTERIQHNCCCRQCHRVNASDDGIQVYYKLVICPLIRVLDHILMVLEERFYAQ